jgi:hypothetical protein
MGSKRSYITLKPAVHRCRRCKGDLLLEDYLNERGEAGWPGPHRRRPMCRKNCCQVLVALSQRFCRIREADVCKWGRHSFSVSSCYFVDRVSCFHLLYDPRNNTKNHEQSFSDVPGRARGNSQTRCGHRGIHSDAPNACGFCSNLQTISRDETEPCR